MQTTFQKQEQGTLLSLPPLVFQVSGLQQGPQLEYPIRTQSWPRVGFASRGVGAYKASHFGCKPHEYSDTIFVSMLSQGVADLSVFSHLFLDGVWWFIEDVIVLHCVCVCVCVCICVCSAAVLLLPLLLLLLLLLRLCLCLCVSVSVSVSAFVSVSVSVSHLI